MVWKSAWIRSIFLHGYGVLVVRIVIVGIKILFDDLRVTAAQVCVTAAKLKNKTVLDTISIDDLYNNLKVYKPEVKGMSSSSLSTQNIAFVSSSNNNNSSTNGAVSTAQAINTANGVSAANT
ncbi:hypothetical protein Tco_0469763 [Tanacetum coccineum]